MGDLTLYKDGIIFNWTPTIDNINALPEPIKNYIHELVSTSDPAGMVAENVLLRENVEALLIKIKELKIQILKGVKRMTLEEKQLVMNIARDICVENLRKLPKMMNVSVPESFSKVVKDVKEGLDILATPTGVASNTV